MSVTAIHELTELMLAEAATTGLSRLVLKGTASMALIMLVAALKVPITYLIRKIIQQKGKNVMTNFQKFTKWIASNKKSLTGTVVGAAGTALGITGAWTIDNLPVIDINGFNAAPIVYTAACLLLYILNQLGICGKGFESIITYAARKQTEAEQAETAKVEAAAKKELAAAEENAKKAEEEAKRQIEAAAFAAKVEEMKQRMLNP